MNTINGVVITEENFYENSSIATQAINFVLFGEEQEINGVMYSDYDDVKGALSAIGYIFGEVEESSDAGVGERVRDALASIV